MGQCPLSRQPEEGQGRPEEVAGSGKRKVQFDKPTKVMKKPCNTSIQDDLVRMVSLDSITKMG